jgi:hypothetical protein
MSETIISEMPDEPSADATQDQWNKFYQARAEITVKAMTKSELLESQLLYMVMPREFFSFEKFLKLAIDEELKRRTDLAMSE